MPEPIVPKDDKPVIETGKQDNDVKVDAFGNEIDPPVVEEKEEEGEKERGKEKEPTLAELKAELALANEKIASMGGNLSGQRTIISNLEKLIAEKNTVSPSKEDALKEFADKLPWKATDIVFSKDLPKATLDDMTDNEIRLHDDLMKNREMMNKEALGRLTQDKEQGTKKAEDLNSSVRNHAKELAGGDEALANQIIENVKQFNLNGLSEEEVKARVESAHKLLPTYTPPKEKKTVTGRPVTTTETSKDPFGTDKIVEEVASKRNGQTFSL